MKEVALFDFDGTVTFIDTTKFLLLEFLKKKPLKLFISVRLLISIKFSKDAKEIQTSKNNLVANLIKGMSIEEINIIVNAFQEKTRTHIRPRVLDRIKKFSLEDKHILIVTASPSFAIDGFFEDDKIHVIGTEFTIKDGVYDGNIETTSCYGYEKVKRINQWSIINNVEIKILESWSDSLSDLPMMNLTDNRFWVGKINNKEIFQKEDPLGVFLHD